MNILTLHGKAYRNVNPVSQKKMIEKLKVHGVSATFKAFETAHDLNEHLIKKVKNWLNVHGYSKESAS